MELLPIRLVKVLCTWFQTKLYKLPRPASKTKFTFAFYPFSGQPSINKHTIRHIPTFRLKEISSFRPIVSRIYTQSRTELQSQSKISGHLASQETPLLSVTAMISTFPFQHFFQTCETTLSRENRAKGS